jgi:outer membrane lipoprotein-sorting protein
MAAWGVPLRYDVQPRKLVVMIRGRSRWLAAAAVPLVFGAGALTWSVQANAAEDLPAKSPEEVLAMALRGDVRTFSGALEQFSELGLPQLPDTGPAGDTGLASALDLFAGTHAARVFIDGPDRARLQVMDRLAERDVIRQGREVWLYNSRDNTAAHLSLPEHSRSGAGSAEDFGPSDMAQTPDQLARRLLSAVDPSTEISVGPNTEVADRAAYELVLDPRSADTLVDSVTIAVDGQTGLPLSVQVQARGQQDPAFRLAFTELRLQAPSAELFTFTPPPGAQVQEHTLQAPTSDPGNSGSSRHNSQYTVAGEGWDAVVELPVGSVPADAAASDLLRQATYAVPGGRAVSTALLSVLLTDDGRVFAGSVPLPRLQAAAEAR